MTRGPLTELGLSKAEEFSELQGTGALLLLLPALPPVGSGQEDQDVPLLSALLQLKQLQQINSWHCPLPLVVLVPGRWGAADTQKLEEGQNQRVLLVQVPEMFLTTFVLMVPFSSDAAQTDEGRAPLRVHLLLLTRDHQRPAGVQTGETWIKPGVFCYNVTPTSWIFDFLCICCQPAQPS